MNRTSSSAPRPVSKSQSMDPHQMSASVSEHEWRIGELEWEAWMRVLDSAGFHTGHVYRQPALRFTSRSPFSVSNLSEIATPPCSSSMGQVGFTVLALFAESEHRSAE